MRITHRTNCSDDGPPIVSVPEDEYNEKPEDDPTHYPIIIPPPKQDPPEPPATPGDPIDWLEWEQEFFAETAGELCSWVCIGQDEILMHLQTMLFAGLSIADLGIHIAGDNKTCISIPGYTYQQWKLLNSTGGTVNSGNCNTDPQFDNLPAGDYKLEVTASSGKTGTYTFDLWVP